MNSWGVFDELLGRILSDHPPPRNSSRKWVGLLVEIPDPKNGS